MFHIQINPTQYVFHEDTETCTPLYTTYYFLIQIKGDVIPIEVKAEENLRSKSLKAYVDKLEPEYAIRTSMKDYREQDWLVNIPLWCVSGLAALSPKNKEREDQCLNIEDSG